MKTTTVLAGLALAALATFSPAQDTLAPGFAQTGSLPLPAAFAAYQTLSNGNRVVFDGVNVDLYDGANNHLLHLGDLPGFVFPSFVRANPAETFVLIGENLNGDLFRVQLDGSGLAFVATLAFNFDAVFEDAVHALVSAATCGFGCGNDIVRVNTSSGASTVVAIVPGPSGPLARTANGSLLYATQSDTFPTPPGSVDIVFWTQGQLSSGLVLGLPDATLFHAGLDGAISLDVDPVFGNVFVAESIFGATSRILEIDKQGALVGSVVESPAFLTTLELRLGGGPGHFHAFQPPDGVFLHYSNGDVVTVRPARPVGSISSVGPVTTFQVSGALADSAMLVLWGAQSTYDPNETAYPIFPSFLFLTGMPLAQIRRQPFLMPVDSNGVGTFSIFDPGNLAGTLVFQALMTDHAGTTFIASSSAALN